jgi:hypothetical protein
MQLKESAPRSRDSHQLHRTQATQGNAEIQVDKTQTVFNNAGRVNLHAVPNKGVGYHRGGQDERRGRMTLRPRVYSKETSESPEQKNHLLYKDYSFKGEQKPHDFNDLPLNADLTRIYDRSLSIL